MLPKGSCDAVWMRMPNDLCISLKSSILLLFALMRSPCWKNSDATTQIEGFCRQVEKILGDGTCWWLAIPFICGLNISYPFMLHAKFFLPSITLISVQRCLGCWGVPVQFAPSAVKPWGWFCSWQNKISSNDFPILYISLMDKSISCFRNNKIHVRQVISNLHYRYG